MKYAIFDEKGLPKAFYSDDIHDKIPQEAEPITDTQWLEFTNNQGRRKWDFEIQEVVEYNPEDELTLDDWKQRKKQEIAKARYEAETGGITLPDGTVVKTDRESQSLLMGAALFAKEDPTYTVNWKGENGWVVLDAQTILYLASQVRAHVQSCFDKEKYLHDLIDRATTIEEVQSISWNSL